ncbi:MAG: ATP synthase subunit C [Thermoproteota archaeon]|jgi:V/A-type H+-transporting ATPase subunit K
MGKTTFLTIITILFFITIPFVNAQGGELEEGLRLVGAALAIGLAAIGAGIAIAYSGAASIAAVAEKPAMRAWSFIVLGLSEALAIYGLIIAFLLLLRVF